mmetsp:Transcript_21453/g.38497  ORF Transcript_21453/g.38497 Transcript_21453/m.38497 type:complete len:98 (+) Transcript_21453:2159-2452(+)
MCSAPLCPTEKTRKDMWTPTSPIQGGAANMWHVSWGQVECPKVTVCGLQQLQILPATLHPLAVSSHQSMPLSTRGRTLQSDVNVLDMPASQKTVTAE